MKKTAAKKNVSVFHDLGFSPAEAENLRIRAAMMNTLIDAIEGRKLTQAQAAKLLGVTQPRISDVFVYHVRSRHNRRRASRTSG